MPRNIARYAVTVGLQGCYMPDTVYGPVEYATRWQLAEAIRYEISEAGFPASCFQQAKVRDLWRFIQRHGSSSAHFTITHGGREIAFHGVTEVEFKQAQAEVFG